VRRRAEPIQAEPLRVARQPQRAVADQAGAQQRCGLETGVPVGERKAEALVGDRLLCVATVDRVAGEASVVAEVLAPGTAVAASPARPAEPGHADDLTRLETLRIGPALGDRGDDLVTEDERQLRLG
jgi:hypothetical protein